MTLPFAVLGALVAALLETAVLPELPIAGTQPDLVLALAVVATMVLSAEDGFVWAFVGGLMLDLLIPARPVGAAMLSLLLVVGLAALLARILGHGQRLYAVLSVALFTWLFHLVLFAVLVLTQGVALGAFDPRLVTAAALMNLVLAVPAVLLFSALERRFAPERADWA